MILFGRRIITQSEIKSEKYEKKKWQRREQNFQIVRMYTFWPPYTSHTLDELLCENCEEIYNTYLADQAYQSLPCFDCSRL